MYTLKSNTLYNANYIIQTVMFKQLLIIWLYYITINYMILHSDIFCTQVSFKIPIYHVSASISSSEIKNNLGNYLAKYYANQSVIENTIEIT